MSPRALLLVPAVVVATSLLFARVAAADELSPGNGDAGQITAVNSGVSELSLETMFALGFDKRGDVTDYRSFLVTGPTFRYFITRNGVLGFNVSFLYHNVEGQLPSSSLGGALNVNIGYMLSLANGMFLKPILGAGFFYAQRSSSVVIAGMETTASAPSYGALLRSGLDIVFYSSSRFNLFGGPEFVIALGTSDDTQVDGVQVQGDSFITVDGGFNVGISYVF